MKISLIQSELFWEQPEKNLTAFAEKLRPLYHQSDLVLLPEMFTTGFSMHAESLCETMDGKAVQWMQTQASAGQFLLGGSLIIREGNHIYNRLVLAFPDGQILYYDKKHLFTMGDEPNHYNAGTHSLQFVYKNWKFKAVICYDIRFPVWCRNEDGYDILLVVANWPEVRSYPWRQLLIARAIENQCYVAAVNRVGVDGNGMNHAGNSMIINPRGEVLQENMGENTILEYIADRESLYQLRKQFPVLDDRDPFQFI